MSADGSADAAHSSGSTRVRWRILALLVLSGFVAYILRTNLSVAGVEMMRDLRITPIQLGWIFAAFNWGYGIFQFPGGVIGSRVGARFGLTAIMVAWAVLNLATGLIPVMSVTAVIGVLLVVRFLMGVAQAPLYPIVTGAGIAHWFPPSGWALPNGLSTAGNLVGGAVTGPLIAALVVRFGWRQSFVITAPLALGAALVWWWYGRDEPSQHPGTDEAEVALIEAGRPDPLPDVPGAWKYVLRDRNVLLLTASYFCMNYVFYIFFNWFFIYLVEVRGFDVLQGGVVAIVPWIAGAIGGAGGGWWCDRLVSRRGIRAGCRITGIVALLLAAVLLFGGAAAPRAWMAVLFLSLCFLFTQATDGAYWAATTAVSGRYAAAACGVLNTGGNIVGGFGALLVPITAEQFGWVAALSTGSVFAVVGALLWLLIRPDEQMKIQA